jgi:hypothetical protein
VNDVFNSLNEQTKKYYYDIERHFLRKKAFHVGVILSIIMILTVGMLISVKIDIGFIVLCSLIFLSLIGLNALFFYNVKLFPDFHISMYATAFGLYLIALGLILEIRHPSIFTILFLFYGVIAIYQHSKTSTLNNFFLFLSGSVIVLGFPNMFSTNGLVSITAYIYSFMLIFVIILSISSFILIKQKERYYWNVAIVREQELRTIKTMFDLEDELTDRAFDVSTYYDKLDTFSSALTEKIGIKNVFSERINMLRELSMENEKSMPNGTMDYAPSDLEELKQLEMKPNDKMSYVAFKIAQYATVDFKDGPKTTNLDALTKSFDNLKDTTAVKIVAFSVLIALLRTKRSYLDALSIEEIEVILDKDEFARLFDERLLKFFKSNKDMFKKITDPDISGGDSHDLHHH